MEWQSLFSGSMSASVVGGAGALFAAVLIWTMVWKGLALWKAARQGSKVWFVVLLIVNTIGILEILYIYVFSRKSAKPVPPPTQNPV